MKQRTDSLVASDEKLHQLLMWVNQKSLSVKVPYKAAAVRAFYFALDRDLDRALDRILDRALVPALDRALVPALDHALDRDLDFALDPALDHDLVPTLIPALDLALDRTLVPALIPALDLALDPILVRVLNPTLLRTFNRVLVRALEPELRQSLQQLKEQLPDPNSDEERFKQWWKAHGQAWTEQLRAVMIEHRNIGHDWQLSYQQRQVLTQYYEANQLLVNCLNSSFNVTPAVREAIEETLWLPIAEI